MSFARILFAWQGRIDRAAFIGVSALVFGPTTLASSLGLDAMALFSARWRLASLALRLALGWIGVALTAKRLRDAARPAEWAFAPLVVGLAGAGYAASGPGFDPIGLLDQAADSLNGLSAAGFVGAALGLYLTFAPTSPDAEGELLRPFASARVRENRRGGEQLDAALARALDGRSGEPRREDRPTPGRAPAVNRAAPAPRQAASFGRRR